MAYGGGLGTIARVDWAPQVGNVHTGAVPPWLVDSEDDYKQRNSFQSQSSDTGAVATTSTRGRSGEKLKHDPNWLPNFGGVWESGPRSKTKLAFQQTARLRRKAVATRPLDRRSEMPTLAGVAESTPLASLRRSSGAEADRTGETAPTTVSEEATVPSGMDVMPAKQVQAVPMPLAEPTISASPTVAPPLPPQPSQMQPPAQPLLHSGPSSAALVRLLCTPLELLRLRHSPSRALVVPID